MEIIIERQWQWAGKAQEAIDALIADWQFLEVSRVGADHTYRFKPLHRLLADVHAPRLFHLHVTQVLQTEVCKS